MKRGRVENFIQIADSRDSPIRSVMHKPMDLTLQGILDVAFRVKANGTVVGSAHHLPVVIQFGSSHKWLSFPVVCRAYWLIFLYAMDRYTHCMLKRHTQYISEQTT